MKLHNVWLLLITTISSIYGTDRGQPINEFGHVYTCAQCEKFGAPRLSALVASPNFPGRHLDTSPCRVPEDDKYFSVHTNDKAFARCPVCYRPFLLRSSQGMQQFINHLEQHKIASARIEEIRAPLRNFSPKAIRKHNDEARSFFLFVRNLERNRKAALSSSASSVAEPMPVEPATKKRSVEDQKDQNPAPLKKYRAEKKVVATHQ